MRWMITGILALSTTAFSSGLSVDTMDLPPIQKEKLVNGKIFNLERNADVQSEISSRWDSLENGFTANLSQAERDLYFALKDQFILQRAHLIAIRDSLALLSPEERKIAIENARQEIQSKLQAVEDQVMSRLYSELRSARTQRRAEIEKKRSEIKRHLEEIRQKLQERISQ